MSSVFFNGSKKKERKEFRLMIKTTALTQVSGKIARISSPKYLRYVVCLHKHSQELENISWSLYSLSLIK